MMNTADLEQLKENLATKVGVLNIKIRNGEVSEDAAELVDIYKEYEQHGTTIEELKLLFEDVLLALCEAKGAKP